MLESWNYQDVVRSVEALRSHHLSPGERYTVSELVLDATADRIASRALRRAAHDLQGSDPSVHIIVNWLLERAAEYHEQS